MTLSWLTTYSSVAQTDIVCGSGTYSYGFASAVGDLHGTTNVRTPPYLGLSVITAGSYTIIISTFEAQKNLGPFSLRAEGSRRISLEAIPQEGAGMYSKMVKGSWSVTTPKRLGAVLTREFPGRGTLQLGVLVRAGTWKIRYPTCTSHRRARSSTYHRSLLHSRWSYELAYRIRLQLAGRHSSPFVTPALNVTVFPHRPENSPLPAHITTSGPYSDAISGVVTPSVTMKRGEYLIVPSTFREGIEASFRMEIFCTDVGFKVQPRA